MLLCLFNVCSLYFKSFFPAPISYFPASLSQQVPVSDSPPPWLTGPWQRQLIRLGKAATHFSLCFGCWASLPSFAYPACPVHLPVLVGLPPDDSMVHLSCVVVSFLCKPLCFPLCLFVCWTKLILIGSCQCLQSQSGYRGVHIQAHTNRDTYTQHTSLSPLLPRSGWTEWSLNPPVMQELLSLIMH